tara:strand:+ start:327 stop:470 length:144 start_codon:yes stop_codon:yes gene_type:complete
VSIVDTQTREGSVDRIDDHSVLPAFLGTGQQSLAEGGIDSRIEVAWR